MPLRSPTPPPAGGRVRTRGGPHRYIAEGWRNLDPVDTPPQEPDGEEPLPPAILARVRNGQRSTTPHKRSPPRPRRPTPEPPPTRGPSTTGSKQRHRTENTFSRAFAAYNPMMGAHDATKVPLNECPPETMAGSSAPHAARRTEPRRRRPRNRRGGPTPTHPQPERTTPRPHPQPHRAPTHAATPSPPHARVVEGPKSSYPRAYHLSSSGGRGVQHHQCHPDHPPFRGACPCNRHYVGAPPSPGSPPVPYVPVPAARPLSHAQSNVT